MPMMSQKNETQTVTRCRQYQEHILCSLLRKGPTVPSVFIHGHTASGKTLCIKNILERNQLVYVMVHCAELYSARLIYEHIISQLEGGEVSGRCDDMNSFVRLLRKTLQTNYSGGTVYLVFERSDRLRNLPANVLPALLRLQELTMSQVCVILESEIIWENFRQFSTGCQEPITLHFTPYSKDDLIEILTADPPEQCTNEFYKNYCSLIVNVFFSTTRNLREIKYLVRMNYRKYREPVETLTVAESNYRALWKAIEPQLKTAMNSIYLHQVSSSQWEKAQAQDEDAVKLTDSNVTQNIELPYFSKYLLISSYLASYNPAKSDRRFFVKNAGKMKKTARMMNKNERTGSQILGPKQFQLDRLMAIFYSIVEGKVLPTTHLYTQISNLVSLQLLSAVGSDSQFDTPKYKCLVGLEFVQSIARTVQFDVLHYLYDFN